ncbi:MAG TPA: methyl-accepting chemotaxis protein [Gemmatimonadaceae bacterium]|nr:methyl-accepting chemotaxis protein [Gemmatimonadaceae bacterium]
MPPSRPPSPTPVTTGATPEAFAPGSALSIRFVPLTALAAALILVTLGMVVSGEVASALRGRADGHLQTVAKQYAALAQVAAATRPQASPDLTADPALRTTLQDVFATASASEIEVELADSAGHPLISSRDATSSDLQAFARAASTGGDTVFTVVTSRGQERVALATANLGRWVVLAHETPATATYRDVRETIVAVGAFLFLIIVGIGFAVERLVNQHIRRPAMELAVLAEAVAAGNLTARVPTVRSTDEIERLARALGAMVGELARLARVLSASAGDTATMSVQITASSEQMAGSAAQIAQTASDLSKQSEQMAESVQSLAASSDSLGPLVEQLNAGAHEGVERNGRLRELALENRRLMDDSTNALATLTSDVAATAATVRALVEASQEIRTFVALVQSLARHSKLLALNAAMEAARAGDQGEGFAVVAAEVRRLSAMSSDAAERAHRVVTGVLTGVERSSEGMERMAATARGVQRATEQASASFAHLEASVAELETWTSSIERTAAGTDALVRDMSERLVMITRGTESFAAAMQQVAAASEEQSASTQEIVAAAATMAHAAERLSTLVSNLRIGRSKRSEGTPARGTAPGRTS